MLSFWLWVGPRLLYVAAFYFDCCSISLYKCTTISLFWLFFTLCLHYMVNFNEAAENMSVSLTRMSLGLVMRLAKRRNHTLYWNIDFCVLLLLVLILLIRIKTWNITQGTPALSLHWLPNCQVSALFSILIFWTSLHNTLTMASITMFL